LVPITNSNEDNETAVLSKWLNSHPARLPMFFKVTRLTAGDCHHDFRLGLFGRVNEYNGDITSSDDADFIAQALGTAS
jgi:hypothetical protein